MSSRRLARLASLSAALLGVALLVGCGQRGPLALPEREPPGETPDEDGEADER